MIVRASAQGIQRRSTLNVLSGSVSFRGRFYHEVVCARCIFIIKGGQLNIYDVYGDIHQIDNKENTAIT